MTAAARAGLPVYYGDALPPSYAAGQAIAPVGRAVGKPVHVLSHEILPPHVLGLTTFEADAACVWLNDRTVDGLAANDPDAWFTVFHEVAHVLFDGDALAGAGPPPADVKGPMEQRADAFAAFVMATIRAAWAISRSRTEALIGQVAP